MGAVLIAGLAATLRARGVAQAMVLGRIEESHRMALGHASVATRVAASIAQRDERAPRTDGAPLLIVQDGRAWEVRLFDVEGLIDLYLAPPELLALLGDGVAIAQQREVALQSLIPGEKFASEAQTLARLGFGAEERVRLGPFVTQRAQTGEINPTLAPQELREALAGLPPRLDTHGGVQAELWIRYCPDASTDQPPAECPDPEQGS